MDEAKKSAHIVDRTGQQWGQYRIISSLEQGRFSKAYLGEHVGDHRAMVRGPDGKWFKRRLEDEEAQVQQLWCTFPATDAEVLFGLRRHIRGSIRAYIRSH